MIEERFVFENSDEKVMITGATAFSVYMHNAERITAASGLSFGDIMVLKYLHSRNGEVNLRQLKDSVMMLSGASITKITEKLVKKGFINRRENPKSRREKLVRINPNGERLYARLQREIFMLNDKATKGLSTADKSHLFNNMKTILGNISKPGIDD